jgi:hypothetical protein
MKLPKIYECSIQTCAYNQDNKCHALAITIGGPRPCCDTFLNYPIKGGTADRASVGACKVVDCKFNDKLECSATKIKVSANKCIAECMTYEMR